MRYLKNFETLNDNDPRNKIFIIDGSYSFLNILISQIDKINFYLADKFTVIIFTDIIEDVFENITLKELISKIKSFKFQVGGSDVDDVLNYITDHKIKGNTLIFSDGGFPIDITDFKNNLTFLYTEFKPIFKGKKYFKRKLYLFKDDLESYDFFYPPRDITPERYEINKDANKYTL